MALRKRKKAQKKAFVNQEKNLGGFCIRITESRLIIETVTKDWRQSFSNDTVEYGVMVHAFSKGVEDDDNIKYICVTLYSVRMVLQDFEFLKEVNQARDRMLDRIKAAPEDPKADAEALAEEKVFTEKTAESIKELEEVKND